jgi:hypothetical protein
MRVDGRTGKNFRRCGKNGGVASAQAGGARRSAH